MGKERDLEELLRHPDGTIRRMAQLALEYKRHGIDLPVWGHRCPRCGSKMVIMHDDVPWEKCPKCGLIAIG